MTHPYVDSPENINTVEWFFGYGGNHLGLRRIIPRMRLVAACEIEAYALANMVAKMEAGLLDSAPIWTDCTTFPVQPFKDRIDFFVASYPCQGFSTAGKRMGADDPRHLWPFARRFVQCVRPLYCLFENVEGHISLGLSTVLSDLEEDGYKTAWGIFSAAEIGASHVRKRVFILAKLEHANHRPGGTQSEQQPEDWGEILARAGVKNMALTLRQRERGSAARAGWVRVRFAAECGACQCCDEPFCPVCNCHYADCACVGPHQEDEYEYCERDGVLFARPLADPGSAGREGGQQREALPGNGDGPQAHGSTGELRSPCAGIGTLAHTDERNLQQRSGIGPVGGSAEAARPCREFTGSSGGLPVYPPGPGDFAAWDKVLRVAPSFEPAVRGMAHGHSYRVDRLRLLGNGVVPDVVTNAFLTLLAEINS